MTTLEVTLCGIGGLAVILAYAVLCIADHRAPEPETETSLDAAIVLFGMAKTVLFSLFFVYKLAFDRDGFADSSYTILGIYMFLSTLEMTYNLVRSGK